MPRHKGIWRQAWGRCDRCGFEHPLGTLTKQKGLRLCSCHGCIDDLLVERRQAKIAEVLAGKPEGVSEETETQLISDPGEIQF